MGRDSRETFGSSWGTLLATAGVAIGLGNVWRFPYMMGAYGGAGFLIVYLIIVFALGVPALMCEWALGRATQRGPMGAFSRAGVPFGGFWGFLLVLTIAMAVSYYAVIVGWVLHYAAFFAFQAPDAASVKSEFGRLTAGIWPQFIPVWVCVLAGCASLYFGVRGGIERLSKAATPLFFFLFAILTVVVFRMEGAWTSLVDYLSQSASQFTPRTVLAALGQGLFSLGVGGTFMVIYGSYMRRSENITRGAVMTVSLDVSAALIASLIVLPSVLVFGVELGSGPPMLFEAMPLVFAQMTGGRLVGALFFVSILLVAMLSVIGAYEVVAAAVRDALGWSRKKSLLFVLFTQSVLIVPPMLSIPYITASDLFWGSTMHPVGATVAVVALVWFIGRAKALEEIRSSSSLPFPSFFFFWVKYVVPAAIAAGLIYGWQEA